MLEFLATIPIAKADGGPSHIDIGRFGRPPAISCAHFFPAFANFAENGKNGANTRRPLILAAQGVEAENGFSTVSFFSRRGTA